MTLRFVSHVVMAATLYQVQRFASPARQGNSTNQGKKGALIALLVGFLSQLVRVLRPLAFHVTQGNTLHMWDPLPVMFVGLGRVSFFWLGSGLGPFKKVRVGSRVLKNLLRSTSGPYFPQNIIQIWAK